jgi:Family of unknown function (DUF6491)
LKIGAGSSAALLCLLVCAAMADTPAPAPAQAPAPEAQIAFANHGGIYNWQVVDDRTVLIQSQDRKWYKATLLSPCFDLPFAERLGFESNSDGSFDKFSAIQVRSQKCPLTSLVETTAPAKKAKAKKTGAAPASVTPPATTPPATAAPVSLDK